MPEIKSLNNGVRVAIEKLGSVRSISFGIFVMNGSRNETRENNGISHFIEHMLFKGTKKRSAKDIADEMDNLGGQLNAYTTKEYTCYYVRVLDEHFDIALDVLSDMFFNSNFDEAEINKERNVILEEISMYEDTPEDLAHDLMQLNVWEGDPLGFPTLGTAGSIGTFNHDVLKGYAKNNYRPENTVLAVAGNFDESEIMKKLENAFSRFETAPKYISNIKPVSYKSCIIKKDKDVEQLHLCFGFPGVATGSDDTYAVAALNTIFGGGMSSRLFQNIREKYGLAYSVYSYNSSFINAGMFNIYAALNPGQCKDYVGLVKQEIDLLFSEKMTQDELKKTKEQLKSNYILSLESSSNRMSSIGRSALLLDRILTPDDLIKKIDEINIEKIYEISDYIFRSDKMSATAVGRVLGLDIEGMIGSF